MVQNEKLAGIVQNVAAQASALNQVLDLLKSKNISKEEHEKLWTEAYERAVALLDYKIKMGELIAETPEGKKGPKQNYVPVGNELSKKDVYEALGLTHKQAADYQLLVKNLKAVKQAKLEAKENKCLPTVYQVKKIIKLANESQEGTTVNDNSTPTPSSDVQNESTAGNEVSETTSSETQNPSDEVSPASDDASPTTAGEMPAIKCMNCIDLPKNCDIKEFVSSAMGKLNLTKKKKVFIYVEVLPDEVPEYFENFIANANTRQVGICVNK